MCAVPDIWSLPDLTLARLFAELSVQVPCPRGRVPESLADKKRLTRHVNGPTHCFLCSELIWYYYVSLASHIMELKAVLLLEIVFWTQVFWLLLLMLFLAWALWGKQICLHIETSHQRWQQPCCQYLSFIAKALSLLGIKISASSQPTRSVPLRATPLGEASRIWDFLLACGSTWGCWNHSVCSAMLCNDLKEYFYMNFSVENINK